MVCKKRSLWYTRGYREIPLCEDYDFTLRAVLSGFKISNLNKPVLNYRMTINSISRSNLFEQYLYGCYLTKEYKIGNIANIKDAKNYVERRNNIKIQRDIWKPIVDLIWHWEI